MRADPRAVDARVGLAGAYLQKARETGDPSFYTRADGLLRAALARRPGDAGALVASAGLALSRHDFRGGLELARRARAARPRLLAPYPALVDALVELGRFGAAERTLQRMVDAKPTLAGYARVSYLRELHGDLDGAAAAMRRAVAAGGPARESVAAVQALLGGIELAREPAASGQAARSARHSRRSRATRPPRRAWRASTPPAAISARRSGAGGRSPSGCRCPSTCSASPRRSSPPGARARPVATWR